MNARNYFTAIIYLGEIVSHIQSKPTAESDTGFPSGYGGLDFRIIGGKRTGIEDFPFVVSIQRRYQRHLCGGTYILPNFILSAAHCMVTRSKRDEKFRLISPQVFLAIAGSTGVKNLHGSKMQIRLINRVLPHPLYNPKNMHHDIGLYRLAEPFRITRFIYPSPIPNSIDDALARTNFPNCTVVGWGRLKTGSDVGYGHILRQVQVPLVPVAKCKNQVHPSVNEDSQLCAGVDEGGVDSCQGDSGGPMLCENFQVGIVSWGIGCGDKKSPGIYTRIDFYLDWLNHTIGRNASSSPFDSYYAAFCYFLTFLIYLY